MPGSLALPPGELGLRIDPDEGPSSRPDGHHRPHAARPPARPGKGLQGRSRQRSDADSHRIARDRAPGDRVGEFRFRSNPSFIRGRRERGGDGLPPRPPKDFRSAGIEPGCEQPSKARILRGPGAGRDLLRGGMRTDGNRLLDSASGPHLDKSVPISLREDTAWLAVRRSTAPLNSAFGGRAAAGG